MTSAVRALLSFQSGLLVVLVAGCGQGLVQPGGNPPPDMATVRDLTPPDLTPPKDLSVPKAVADLAVADLAVADLSVADLSVADLAVADLAVADLAVAGDLSVVDFAPAPADLRPAPCSSASPCVADGGIPDGGAPLACCAGACVSSGEDGNCGACDVSCSGTTPVCKRDGTGCGQCNGDGDCASLAACASTGCTCQSGTCVPKPAPLGTSCGSGASCASGSCVDGVCCDTSLANCGGCSACNVAGSVGHCTSVPSTQDPHGACSLDVAHCLLGACNGSGSCVAGDGAGCDDGNACTQTDSCLSGSCVGANPVSCPLPDQCHSAGACDVATGVCSNPPLLDNTPCNDGNACTQTDTCQAGVCTGGDPIVCAPLDQCHLAGTCDPTSGVCTTPTEGDGAGCDDGNACTQVDQCVTGVCTGQDPVVCTASDQCHLAGTCNPLDATCSNPNQTDGTGCNDGNTCTIADVCSGGICAGTAITCTTSVCGASLTAFTGTQTAGWSLNGVAAYDTTAQTVVLIPAGTLDSAGSVIYQNPIVVDGATASFDFRMMTSVGNRADGIMLLMETNGKSAVGALGAGLGGLGLTGYGLELDIFDNGMCADSNGNHAGVDVLASPCPANAALMNSIAVSSDLFDASAPDNGVGDIGDGQWRTATVTIAGGTMSVSITDPTSGTPIAVPNLQLVPLPGYVAGTPYYFGLSAGSGGQASRQEIRNVQVTFPGVTCL